MRLFLVMLSFATSSTHPVRAFSHRACPPIPPVTTLDHNRSHLGWVGLQVSACYFFGWHTVLCQFTVFSCSIHMYFWLIALMYDLIHTWYDSLGPTAHQRGRQVLFGRSWTHSRRSETYASAAHAV